jgi:hypothetical protein
MNTTVSARPATHAFPLALLVLALGVLTVMPQWQRPGTSPMAFAAPASATSEPTAAAEGTMLPYGVFPGHAMTSAQHTLPYGTP